MMDDFAEAVSRLEEEVDRACSRARNALSPKEIATELRRIADGWEEEE